MLLVGLGNPGKKYERTPHNAGFMALEQFVQRHDATAQLSENKKLSAQIASVFFSGRKVICAKPTTFMNVSGKAVRALMDYYKIPLEDVLILHDEADISLGTIKHAFDRGAAGHNGIKSIIQHVGTKAFARIRIGIGQIAEPKIPLENYVLSSLNADQMAALQQGIDQTIADIEAKLSETSS